MPRFQLGVENTFVCQKTELGNPGVAVVAQKLQSGALGCKLKPADNGVNDRKGKASEGIVVSFGCRYQCAYPARNLRTAGKTVQRIDADTGIGERRVKKQKFPVTGSGYVFKMFI